ncbi:MAG: hypothetical protein WKF86_04295, partial [Acidimicrobiales bacterium]
MSIPDRWTGRPRDVTQSAGMAGASRSAILSRVTFHGPKDYLEAARDPAKTAAELQSLAGCPFASYTSRSPNDPTLRSRPSGSSSPTKLVAGTRTGYC